MSLQLNYKIIGQGEPIILLHGLFGMLDNWQTMAKRLADAGYMAILLDQRDHGRSQHSNQFNYALLAEDLRHFMEDNWIHQATLLGHSMGGKTALRFTAEHESMVSSLIIVDMGIKRYAGGHLDVFEALFSIDLAALDSREQAEQQLQSKLRDNGTVQFLMKNLSRKKEGGFEWKMNLALLLKEYQNILAPIEFSHPVHIPACFIRGQQSDYVLDEDIPAIKTALPEATFVTIPGAGHWVHADKPDELFQAIMNCIPKG
jgi:pimeloyl-ACP methyl ester carboxylesterase